MNTEFNLSITELFVRCLLGILFVFQGYDKLFVVRVKNVIETFKAETTERRIPHFLIALVSYFTSITEFFGGLLLIVGVFHLYATYALALNLLVVAVAFSFVKPVWDLHHVFPRVILLVLVLLLSQYFHYGLDILLFK